MTLATIVGVGTPSGGTGASTPGLPAGWVADDLHILVVNNKRAEALTTPTGWTLVDNAVPTADNKLTMFKRDAQSGDAAPTVADPGDHCYAVIVGFRNPNGGTCLVDATVVKATVSVASAVVSWPGLTTPGADRIILHALADGRDATGARFSGQTNAALANLLEQFDNGITSNNGGGLVLVTGEKATAGAIGTTTGTLTSATQALLTISIEAPGAGGVDGNAAGSTMATVSSVVPGTPNGAASIAGAVMSSVASLVAGTANGSAVVIGSTMSRVASLVAGIASGAASAAGVTLISAGALVAGIASAGATASGVTFVKPVAFVAGSASANASANGSTLPIVSSLVPGIASAGTSSTGAGATLSTVSSLTAGAPGGAASVAGATLVDVSSLVAGTARGGATAVGAVMITPVTIAIFVPGVTPQQLTPLDTAYLVGSTWRDVAIRGGVSRDAAIGGQIMPTAHLVGSL